MKTVREVLAEGTTYLKESLTTSETPFLDAMILLSFILKLSKEELLASYPDKINQSDYDAFQDILKRRTFNIPVSYLTNKKEFYGLDFYVDENVLVPRPDSETLVEAAIDILKRYPNKKTILDLCSGSGALGIALKYSLPELDLHFSDLSEKAIDICIKNYQNLLGEKVKIFKSNLFSNIVGKFDMIITNPPYLTNLETDLMMNNNWPEPDIALRGGTDGLDFIRKIINNAPDYLEQNAYILIESSIDQTEIIRQLLDSGKFHNTQIIKDLSGRNRVTLGQRI
jgi:release factor glutamine methyltransferase